jgi:sugar lactone lactonase YvrE
MGRTSRLIAQDLYFPESPRWRAGRLWFSDFYAHAVKSVSLSGDLRTEFEIDDQPSGLGWMPDGALLIVSMIKRSVLIRRAAGPLSLHADLSRIAPFHCNDMVADARGGAYVGNFGFDLEAAFDARGAEAVLADHPTASLTYVSPDGVARVVAENLHFPNGCVIFPDQKTLVVAETLSGALTAFDIEVNGNLSNRRLWASTSPRAPDGIALDQEGAIWIANPLAPECVRIAEGGAVLDRVETTQPCQACALGGDDGQTLFTLTAETFRHRRASVARTGQIWATEV